MSYTPHVLVAFGGSWTDEPSEVWECTVRVGGDGGGGVALDAPAYLAAIAAPLANWYGANNTYMDIKAGLAWVKVNHIAADGTYVDKTTTNVHDYAAPTYGHSPHTLPGYCTLAYTWETANARGPGHRGRIYPPNAVAPATTAFRVSTVTRDACAENGAGLLAVLKNTAGANGTKGTPVVASKVNGAIVPIIGCSVDDIYDVQRRRKNRVKGTRSAVIAFA